MGVRTISQEAFDELVKENMEDLGMDPAEALRDAIDALTLQGVDLSGDEVRKKELMMVTSDLNSGTFLASFLHFLGDNRYGGVNENPVIKCLDRLKQLDSGSKDGIEDRNLDEMLGLFDQLTELCSSEGSGNASIANKNGALQLACSLCYRIQLQSKPVIISCLKAMAALIHDIPSTETFRSCGGPKIVVDLLNDLSQDLGVLDSCFAVVASAVTGNEVVKEAFMALKVDELILQVLNQQSKGGVESVYDAICLLLTPDDNRVVASEVYGYARRFAKIGIARALTDALYAGLSSPGLVSASIALKAVAVNDEICRSIAENGGIDALLQCIDDSGDQGNKTAVKTLCALLSQLARSDSNKNAIVEKRGMDRLIKLATRFSDEPSVQQEVMSIISVLCLRSPDNAAHAIEAGAGDLSIRAMENFPYAAQMQRSSCNMIRNLVVRNPENRTLLLGNGIEKLIRKAKENHGICKNAATDALRDLGLDNYNA